MLNVGQRSVVLVFCIKDCTQSASIISNGMLGTQHLARYVQGGSFVSSYVVCMTCHSVHASAVHLKAFKHPKHLVSSLTIW